MRHLQKLMLLFLPLFLMPPPLLHATCTLAGLQRGAYFSAAEGSPTVAFQQMSPGTGCNLYLTTLFLKVSNVTAGSATTFVVNAYDNYDTVNKVCTGNIENTWTLVVGGTHGSSDVINLTFPVPGSGLPWAGATSYLCIQIPGATGFVSTAGFTGVFNS